LVDKTVKGGGVVERNDQEKREERRAKECGVAETKSDASRVAHLLSS